MSTLSDRADHWLDNTDGSASIEESITFELIKAQRDEINRLREWIKGLEDLNPRGSCFCHRHRQPCGYHEGWGDAADIAQLGLRPPAESEESP